MSSRASSVAELRTGKPCAQRTLGFHAVYGGGGSNPWPAWRCCWRSAATINVGGACSLVDAITAANTDAAAGGCTAGSGANTLRLQAGSTLTLTTANSGITGLPPITSAVAIAGNGSTIRRDVGAAVFRIFLAEQTGSLTVRRVTVSRGGRGVGFGGAVFNRGTLNLADSRISGNAAASGGGVANFAGTGYVGTLTLINSAISGNRANERGGGVFNLGTASLTNSTVAGNSADYGGGVDNGGALNGANTTLSRNTVRLSGGAIFNRSGKTVDLTNSTLSGNSVAFFGGGVSNYGTLSLTSRTLTGNTASTGGGVANFAPATSN